jgi:hypothetical protein
MSCDDVMQSDGRELGFRLTSGTVGLEYWSLLMTRDDRRWGNNERIQLHSPVTTVHFREIKMMPPEARTLQYRKLKCTYQLSIF